MVYLIVDSGSTKTAWLLAENNSSREISYTEGINPVLQREQEIRVVVEKGYRESWGKAEAVFFYGAGCLSAERNALICKVIKQVLGIRQVEVASDLWAAARALCGNRPGIVCILGTGANSCYYDGERIVKNIPPLGYVLGDEGSGAFLGKRLLGNVLKGIWPEELCGLFFKEYPYSYEDLIERVYRKPFPNRFMADLTHFLQKYKAYPEVVKLVKDSFCEFIERNVLLYENVSHLPVSFVGSVAYYFQDLLQDCVNKYGLKTGIILQSPLEGLMRFHCGS